MASINQPRTIQRQVSQPDASFNEVQRKIYGQRNEKLTAIEINTLFQSPITPEFNLLIYRALQRNAINPDITILQAIAHTKSREYLIPIALCIRSGTDVNMYVEAPNVGTVHLLGYVYIVLGGDRFSTRNSTYRGFNEVSTDSDIADDEVLNTIILMLVAKGSRPSMPMFDRKAGKIESDQNNTVTSSPSVTEWLNDKGYTNILSRINVGDASELHRIVDKESLTILSTLLDMPSLMNREYESRDMLLAIRSFSPTTLDKIPTPDAKVMMDYKSLDDSVTYLNSIAYEKLLKRGQLPSYLLINKILIGMRAYKNAGKIIALQELEKMLLSSITIGTQLDQDQLNIVSVLGQDTLQAVTREYEQPYWQKICKAPTSVDKSINGIGVNETPDSLRRLAISLNIDPTMSQSAICDNIVTLSKADKEALKEAARRRQQIRMAGDLGRMNEFLNGKIPNLVCRNKDLLSQNPFDYNDIDFAYYRDDQGAVWCFGSDQFANLIETGVNPYNSTILPESFKDQLRYQINVLKRLGIDASRGEVGIYSSKVPVTFTQSIDSLTAKDTITEKTSEQALNTFIQLASSNGISPETIRSLSKERMTSALQSINYNVNIAPLSTSHALVTTARIIDYLNRTDPESVRIFFSSINIPQILNTSQTF